MIPHSETISLSDMVFHIADEMNIHRTIEDMDMAHASKVKTNVSEKKVGHIYYVSATSEARREKAHIHTILERKNRSCVTHIAPNIFDECRVTVICLCDHLYQDDSVCHEEFNKFVKISQMHSTQLRLVIILLRSDLNMTDQIPENALCLPGIDRVSRELAIFKIVQEE
jgi:hypothetical protein